MSVSLSLPLTKTDMEDLTEYLKSTASAQVLPALRYWIPWSAWKSSAICVWASLTSLVGINLLREGWICRKSWWRFWTPDKEGLPAPERPDSDHRARGAKVTLTVKRFCAAIKSRRQWQRRDWRNRATSREAAEVQRRARHHPQARTKAVDIPRWGRTLRKPKRRKGKCRSTAKPELSSDMTPKALQQKIYELKRKWTQHAQNLEV